MSMSHRGPCCGVHPAGKGGSSDPYVVVHGGLQSGKRTKQLGKTPVIKQNLSPTWNWQQKLYLKEQTNDLARLERMMPGADRLCPAPTCRDRA